MQFLGGAILCIVSKFGPLWFDTCFETPHTRVAVVDSSAEVS